MPISRLNTKVHDLQLFSAGHVENLTGYEVGVEQEVDRIDQILRRTCATERDGRDRSLLMPIAAIFGRKYGSGSDTIDLDPWSELQSQ